MTQPPQPPNEPQQGGFGAPQNPPPGGFGAPQAPQTPPPAQPPTPPAGPPPQAPQAPQTPPPPPPGQPATPPPAPQDAQPGYGYPQTAPGQPPGYGYPQTAPGQPGPYPGQPGPYPGQPGQPAQYGGYPQPGQHGQATMPMTPQATAPATGGKKVNSQMAIIIAAVVAIALIVGGGVFYASTKDGDSKKDTAQGEESKSGGKDGKDGGGGDDAPPAQGPAKEKAPSNPAAQVSLQLPQPTVPDKATWSTKGSWLTDDMYAKSGVNEIIGYTADDGKEKWTLPLTGQTCAGSREVTKDGLAAVVHEEAKRKKDGDYQPCTKVTLFNVNTGQKLWTKSAETSGRASTFQEVTISGTTVAVGGLQGGAAWNTAGKELWGPSVGKCEDKGYAGGDQLVALRKCGTYGDEQLKVELLDPKTGKAKWSYPLTRGIKWASIISTNPVVFGQATGEDATDATDIFALDNKGAMRGKVTLDEKKYDHDCEITRVYSCKGIAVGNDKLYVPTRQHESGGDSYGMTNEIVSFSLATGKSTGDRIDAGKDGEIRPIRMDGPNLLVYKDSGYQQGAQVTSIDGKSLKETKLLETPSSEQVVDTISGMTPTQGELLYTNGHLYLGKELISKPYSKDEKEYVALGFRAQ
ncbi:PQQ-binding-like beta-propeller repeat protein [Actinomycetota bacterium Odt1-20B]